MWCGGRTFLSVVSSSSRKTSSKSVKTTLSSLLLYVSSFFQLETFWKFLQNWRQCLWQWPLSCHKEQKSCEFAPSPMHWHRMCLPRNHLQAIISFWCCRVTGSIQCTVIPKKLLWSAVHRSAVVDTYSRSAKVFFRSFSISRYVLSKKPVKLLQSGITPPVLFPDTDILLTILQNVCTVESGCISSTINVATNFLSNCFIGWTVVVSHKAGCRCHHHLGLLLPML